MNSLGIGSPLGFRTVEEARAEMRQLGPGTANDLRSVEARSPNIEGVDGLVLATWKQLIDNGSMQDGDKYLKATARTPVALVSQQAYDASGRP